MNIDERLEKLTERHEALTQTVELMARENDRITREIDGMKGYISEIAEATARLLHIAQIHEHRITRLEGGQ
jgi:hypothetical protein